MTPPAPGLHGQVRRDHQFAAPADPAFRRHPRPSRRSPDRRRLELPAAPVVGGVELLARAVRDPNIGTLTGPGRASAPSPTTRSVTSSSVGGRPSGKSTSASQSSADTNLEVPRLGVTPGKCPMVVGRPTADARAMTATYEHPSLHLPVTPEQRDRAETWLQEAYADGRISESEFDRRIGQVISAVHPPRAERGVLRPGAGARPGAGPRRPSRLPAAGPPRDAAPGGSRGCRQSPTSRSSSCGCSARYWCSP